MFHKLLATLTLASLYIIVATTSGCKSIQTITPYDAYWEGDGGFAQLQGDVFRYNDSYWKVEYVTNDSLKVLPLRYGMNMTVKFDRDAKMGTATQLHFRQDTITFTIDAVRSTPPDSLHLPYHLKMAYTDSVCTEQYLNGTWVDQSGIIWWFSHPDEAKNKGIYDLVHFKPGTKEFKDFIVMTINCDSLYLMLETAKALKYQILKLNDHQMAVMLTQDGTTSRPINLMRTAEQDVDMSPYHPLTGIEHQAYLKDSTLVPVLQPVQPFDTVFDYSKLQWLPAE